MGHVIPKGIPRLFPPPAHERIRRGRLPAGPDSSEPPLVGAPHQREGGRQTLCERPSEKEMLRRKEQMGKQHVRKGREGKIARQTRAAERKANAEAKANSNQQPDEQVEGE